MDEENAQGLATLAAIAAATRLKARYCRLLDAKDWDGWQALFTDDAVMDVTAEAPYLAAAGAGPIAPDDLIWRGAATIRERVAGALAEVTTVHHGHMGEIDLVDADTIDAVWAMEDRLRYPDPAAPVAGINGFGHYHDRYRRIDGEWRIASLRLSRLLVEPVARRSPS